MPRRTVGIGYWMVNYAPAWEAASKEIDLLRAAYGDGHGARVHGFNLRGTLLELRGDGKRLPLPLALGPLPLVRWLAGACRIHHVFASAGDRIFITRLPPTETLLTIAKQSTFEAFERNFDRLKRLRYVVVESELHRELLRQGGLSEERVRLIYPGVALRGYRGVEGPFTVLFATSPFQKHALVTRGVHLLLRAARELPEIRFLFAWRKHNLAALQRLLKESGVRNVEVQNGYIRDMGAVYDSVHATILPGLSYESLKPAPQSGLDSLAHGKPVLVSRPTSIARIVERERCGVVFEPDLDSLRSAILELRDAYSAYQANCHRTVESNFSEAEFVARYGRLYHSMLRQ